MKQATWNQQIVKMKNKKIVLDIITSLAPISRADIAQHSGLNKATVSSLANELITEQLILESGPGESSGGRRPVMLHFNKKAGYAIGIDIGVNYILGIVTDLSGTIIQQIHTPIQIIPFNQLMELVKKTIHQLIKVTPKSKYGIIGIGIGVPGIVDKQGEVLLAPNLKWENVKLLDILKEEFSYPIYIENEANAGAYGEQKFGAGFDHDNLVYVSIGIGIGVGIIQKGELYRGINGYSGESGHMTIMIDGKECLCGNAGCWEAYASEAALLKESKKISHLKDADLEKLIDLATNGDTITIDLLHKIGGYIGVGISNLIKTFNPQQIIIGNRLATVKDWIERPIVETMKNHTLPFHQENLEIDFSKLSSHSTALGVSAFAIENFLKIDP